MCLWSLLDCKHPYKHKVHIMGDPWYLARESPSSHGEGQEEWERLLWQQNRAQSPERQVRPIVLGLGSGVLKGVRA